MKGEDVSEVLLIVAENAEQSGQLTKPIYISSFRDYG